MTIKLAYHKLDYDHSDQERVGHENQDLPLSPKENASKPLEQHLIIVRVFIPPTISVSLPDLLWKHELPVYFIGQEYYNHYDVIINESDLKNPDTKSFTIEKVDTTNPISGEINIHGQQHARKVALGRFAQNIETMISCGDNRLVSCYRNAAKQGGPCSTSTLNKTIIASLDLAAEFQDSDASVKERFVRDALYLSVAMIGKNDELLARDQQEWNEILTYNMEIPDALELPCGPDRSQAEWATYALCLLKDLLNMSGSGKRGQQRRLSSDDLTPRESLILLCNMFEVPISMPSHLGTRSPVEIQKTVSSSKLLVKDSSISEVEERILVLENYLPIGLPDCARLFDLELLDIFTAREWSSIKTFISQTCAELPSLEYPQHNLPLLLVWSAQCRGRTQEKLFAWAKSDQGIKEYHRMIETLRHRTGLAEMALILGAAKTLLRLCVRESHPQGTAHFSHFISIMNGMCELALPTLEHMSKAFDLVLREQVNGTEYQTIREILALDPTLTYRQSEFEQLYWKCRCAPLRSHEDAVEAIKKDDSGITPSLQKVTSMIGEGCNDASIYIGSLTFGKMPAQAKEIIGLEEKTPPAEV